MPGGHPGNESQQQQQQQQQRQQQQQQWQSEIEDFGSEGYDVTDTDMHAGESNGEDFYQLETVDRGVYDVLCRSEGYLQEVWIASCLLVHVYHQYTDSDFILKVFHYYALLSLPHDRICFADFRRFVRDFRLLTLVSMQEVSDVSLFLETFVALTHNMVPRL